jgi:hypothetical protein
MRNLTMKLKYYALVLFAITALPTSAFGGEKSKAVKVIIKLIPAVPAAMTGAAYFISQYAVPTSTSTKPAPFFIPKR